MTFEEAETIIRINLDDRNSDLFNSDEILLFVNLAYRHVWNKCLAIGYYPIGCVQHWSAQFDSSNQIVTVQKESTYTGELPLLRNEYYHKVLRVEEQSTTGCKIEYVIKDEFEARRSQVPAVFPRNRDKIGYYITPSTTLTVSVFVALQAPRFRTTASTEVSSKIINVGDVQLPDAFEEVVINWATVKLLGTDEKNVQFWSGLYQESLRTLMESFSLRSDYGNMVDDYYADY